MEQLPNKYSKSQLAQHGLAATVHAVVLDGSRAFVPTYRASSPYMPVRHRTSDCSDLPDTASTRLYDLVGPPATVVLLGVITSTGWVEIFSKLHEVIGGWSGWLRHACHRLPRV